MAIPEDEVIRVPVFATILYLDMLADPCINMLRQPKKMAQNP